ncbi:MAG: hypothetical protein SFT91_02490 [Rickettsiaceae bacterium]|nr:hypothetical protein [Rickettsiaceae bacterium]
MNEMTLRLKNIIFFKFVSMSLCSLVFLYMLNMAFLEKEDSWFKMIKARQLVLESEERLNALSIPSEQMTSMLEFYNLLRNYENMNLEECFNSGIYKAQIATLDKKHKLSRATNVQTSSISVPKKFQPKKYLTINSSTVLIDANAESFEQALVFAESAFDALPKYNVVRSFEIDMIDVITPLVAKGLRNPQSVDLVTLSMNMEVKELNLND